MPDFDDDDALLGEIERVLSLTRGLPDHVFAAGYAAFDWPAVDAELARMLEDQPALSVRGAGEALQLRFGLSDFTVELEVLSTPEGQQVTGWLQEPAVVALEVHHSRGHLETQTDADGRFVLEALARGAARIIFSPPGRQPVEVRWASL